MFNCACLISISGIVLFRKCWLSVYKLLFDRLLAWKLVRQMFWCSGGFNKYFNTYIICRFIKLKELPTFRSKKILNSGFNSMKHSANSIWSQIFLDQWNVNLTPGVQLHKLFFMPYALVPNFYASKKLLKTLGVGVRRKWIKQSLWFAPCTQIFWNLPLMADA